MIKQPYKTYDNSEFGIDIHMKNIDEFYEIIGEDNVPCLAVKGQTDWYGYIQASLEETLMENIISKYESGNIEILNQINRVYGDNTEVPTNLMEAQKQIMEVQNIWSELPLEVRNEFNNNVYEFMAEIPESQWQDRILDTKFAKDLKKTTELQQLEIDLNSRKEKAEVQKDE